MDASYEKNAIYIEDFREIQV